MNLILTDQFFAAFSLELAGDGSGGLAVASVRIPTGQSGLLSAPSVTTPGGITPASGPTGTTFTLVPPQGSGGPAPTVTLVKLEQAGVDVTASIVAGAFQSTAAGSLEATWALANGILPNAVATATATVTVPTAQVVTPPSIAPSIYVGTVLSTLAQAGTYSWAGGAVTETWAWRVDGFDQLGSDAILAGDAQIEAFVALSAPGLAAGTVIHVGPIAVKNSPPVAVGGTLSFIVAASGPAPVSFTTAAAALTRFKDTTNWPTTGGKITIAMDLSVTAIGTVQYLYEMDNGHISLQVVADGRLFLSIKDGANTAVITSVVIGTIAAGTRCDIIVAVDLVALTAWTTINGVTTARTLGANSGNLSSASRKLCLLARAGGTTNNVAGTIYKLEVWNDCVSGGGRPASDANLRANGRIAPPAAAVNAHPWKAGGDVT